MNRFLGRARVGILLLCSALTACGIHATVTSADQFPSKERMLPILEKEDRSFPEKERDSVGKALALSFLGLPADASCTSLTWGSHAVQGETVELRDLVATYDTTKGKVTVSVDLAVATYGEKDEHPQKVVLKGFEVDPKVASVVPDDVTLTSH